MTMTAQENDMRRFVFEDLEHDVKVTVDMPELLHAQLQQAKDKLEAIRKLILFTIDKDQENERD